MSVRLALLTVVAASLAACHSDPYCLNCGATGIDLAGVDGGPVDFASTDFAGQVLDLSGVDLFGVLCQPTNGGVEICDGLDNDCNGAVDDVASAKLAADPNNCGKCGNICDFTAQHQFGSCDDSGGTPMCVPGACIPGYVDTNGNPADGCDYACIPTNGGVEICDGVDNDCDKVVDNGFDKMNDPFNCGGCGTVCPHVNGNSTGNCSLGACGAPICDSGFKNLDSDPLNGCEYQCPVFPPVGETCNGKDDDCDGVVDNSPSDVGATCDNFCGTPASCLPGSCTYTLSVHHGGTCYGQCNEGHIVCAGGVKACAATLPLPSIEKCNGVDDNCDGQIDEGFNTATDVNNCGTCGTKCSDKTITNKGSVLAWGCTAGGCKISACQPGFVDFDKDITNGCEKTCANPATSETCNGIDDDCDGLVDELPGDAGNVGSAISVPANFCYQGSICSGARPVCCGASGWLCDYPSTNAGIEIQEAAPVACKCKDTGGACGSVGQSVNGGTLVFVETKCDGKDGDCRNGADDSFLQLNKACTVGNGKCAGTSTFVCGGSTSAGDCAGSNNTAVCCPVSANNAAATAEECNGIDDNCDGQVDEYTPSATGGPYLSGYTDRFVKISSSPALWVYQYEAARTDATSGNAGAASSGRACSRPGVLPWASVTRVQAEAACEAIVLNDSSKHARLCTATEWQKACEGPSGPYTNAYSYSASPTTYVAQVCNDANHAATGPWVTGNDNGQAEKCYVPWSGGNIYDLSGNVNEWTGQTVQVGDMAFDYKVRGGAYNSPSDGTAPDGTSCEFDFDIFPDGYSNKDVGFRCCSDYQP